MADLFLGSIIIMLRWFSQKGEVRLGSERREKGWERKVARETNCASDYGTVQCELGLKNVTCTILTVGEVAG